MKKLNGFDLDTFGNAFLFELLIERKVESGHGNGRKKKMKGMGSENVLSQKQTCISQDCIC